MRLIDLQTRGGPTRGAVPNGNAILALVVMGAVAMLILPLPTLLLDILITCNISLALLVLLVSLHTGGAPGFSAFPGLLLITTMVRLGLNVSSTRLILLQADAGAVIASFGGFVVGGSLVVGAVIFLILTVIQYVVIARGSERVAEVAARFTLDALPGKQLAIDADVRAGLLDRAAAMERRAALERECQLYGAMDGAMKFVKGDAIAAILITLVDMGGGLLIGVFSRGMDLETAASVYTQLTIGDGLVSQIPALLISLAAGIVVTRVASEEADDHLGQQLGRQLLARPRSLLTAAALLGLLALVPGLPALSFALLALGSGALGLFLHRRRRDRTPSAALPRPPVRDLQPSPAVLLEVGTALEPYAAPNTKEGRQLHQLLSWTERLLWEELGLPLSPVEVRAGSDELRSDAFRVLIHGVPSGDGNVDPGLLVALCPRSVLEGAGVSTQGEALLPGLEPPAWHVPAEAFDLLNSQGVQLLEPTVRLALHLAEVLRLRAADLLGVQETQELLDALQRTRPALVREVIPRRLPLAHLTRLLQLLLCEEVSIRELGQILEGVAAIPGDVPAPPLLTELVRQSMGRAISHRLAASDGTLSALLLDPTVEDLLEEAGGSGELPINPDLSRELVEAIERALTTPGGRGLPILLTRPGARRPLRRILEPHLPRLQVLSYGELSPDLKVQTLARVNLA